MRSRGHAVAFFAGRPSSLDKLKARINDEIAKWNAVIDAAKIARI
jgi:hypothetical protein